LSESTLFAATNNGLPVFRSKRASSRSGAVNSVLASTTITIAADSSRATRAWRKISEGMKSLSSGIMPPVSTMRKSCPSQWASPYKRSRVMPGSSPTMARREPTRRLNRVDLPTLGRPTMAIRGILFIWKFRRAWLDRTPRLRSGQASEARSDMVCADA
jgi:hypothetical protein